MVCDYARRKFSLFTALLAWGFFVHLSSLAHPAKAQGQPQFNTQITHSPGVVNFGAVSVSPAGSATAPFTIEAGAATNFNNYVDIYSYTIVGPQAADFHVLSYGCPNPGLPSGFIGPTESCQSQLSFTPTRVGPEAAVLEIAGDYEGLYNFTIYVVLQGTGTAPQSGKDIVLSPQDVNFGIVGLGYSNTVGVTVENIGSASTPVGVPTITGPAAASYSIVTNACSSYSKGLPPAMSCTLSLQFSPKADGESEATLQIPGASPVILDGTGQLASSAVSLSPDGLSLSGIVGQKNFNPDNNFVNISDVGNEPLQISQITITGPNASEFSLNDSGCFPSGVAPGASCFVAVSFDPKMGGLRTATLSIADNAPGSPQTVALAGEAEMPDPTRSLQLTSFGPGAGSPTSPGEINFGPVVVGQASSSPASNSNVGVTLYAPQSSVKVSKIAITGPNASDFLMGSNSCGGTLGICSVPIAFAPSAAGLRTAYLTVTDNAAGSPQQLELAGYGSTAGSDVSAVPSQTDFGVLNVGASSPQVNYAVYYGPGETITSVSIAGPNAADFKLSGCATPCTSFSLQFTPHAPGPRVASIQITYTGGSATIAGNPVTGFGAAGSGYLVAENSPDSSTNDVTESGRVILLPSAPVKSDSFTGAGLLNIGSGPVTVTGTKITGANAGDFTAAPCYPTDVEPASLCELNLQFTPSQIGTRLAMLEIDSNASNAPQFVTLIGMGEPAPNHGAISLGVETLDFGIRTVNRGESTQYLSIFVPYPTSPPVTVNALRITGADAADFSVGYSSCGPNNPGGGGTCLVGVQFHPSSVGPLTADLQVDSNGCPCQPVQLTGVGQAASTAISLSASTVNFGPVNVETWTSQRFSLVNSGDIPLTIKKVTLGGTDAQDFSIAGNFCGVPLPPEATCDLVIAFRPSKSGTRSATLTVADSASATNAAVLLTGTGQTIPYYMAVSASTLNFDAPATGQSITQTLAVVNTGAKPISVSAESISQPQFTIASNTCHTLAVGASCRIGVSFTPSTTGTQVAALTIKSNALNSPLTVALVGQTGTAQPILSSNVSYVDFGVVALGTRSQPQTVVVTSAVALPSVTFNSPSITGPNASDFTLVDACAGTEPGSSAVCGVAVIFKPSITGPETASLNVLSSASLTPLSISLTGSGAPASRTVTATPNPLIFSNSNPDWPGYFPFGVVSLTNTGSQTVHLNSFKVTGTNASQVSLPWGNYDYTNYGYLGTSFCGAVISPGESCAVPIIFNLPTGVSSESATLIISDDAVGSPQKISLQAVVYPY